MLEKHPGSVHTPQELSSLLTPENQSASTVPGDGGPDDLPGIKPGVSPSEEELPTLLIGWLAEKKCQ